MMRRHEAEVAELKPLPEEGVLPHPVITPSPKKARRPKKSIRWRSLIVLAVVFHILATMIGLKLELHRADQRLAELQQQKEQLLAEHRQLLQKKEKLHDPVYIERRARESLGLIKPGEKILTLAKPGEVLPLELEGIDEIGD